MDPNELLTNIHSDNLPNLFNYCASQLTKIYLNDLLTADFIRKFSERVNDLRIRKNQRFIKDALKGMVLVINCLIDHQPKREYDWICRQLAYKNSNSLALGISQMKNRKPAFLNDFEFLGAIEFIIHVKYS